MWESKKQRETKKLKEEKKDRIHFLNVSEIKNAKMQYHDIYKQKQWSPEKSPKENKSSTET